jgi:hypothetical protein
MANDDARILEQLKRATAGLLFMSESDYPFELVQWEGPTDLTPEFLCRVSGEPAGCSVQELEVQDFLTAERYRRLVDVITDNLVEPKAYKVGRINMPVYVVGRSAGGKWLGVSTRVVQT